MPGEPSDTTERLQRMVAALVATQPVGAGLCVVGGFRYRQIDPAAAATLEECGGGRAVLGRVRGLLAGLLGREEPRA